MLHLGAQYYRPPFPEMPYWEEDLRRMKEAGLNTLQLWVLWGWVEPEPGRFQFDDYDRLMDLAGKTGLRVVLSTIAEIQPLWIHREVAGSEMINHLGQKVVSMARNECHFGLTPGGCTDHPEVWRRMARFLETVVTRYRGAAPLAGWDIWNELRWNVQAGSRVCYCPHTLQAFRAWLEARHGSLEGLNRAWKRRYRCWEEVDPGRRTGTPFTENMAFCHFLTWRACEHGRKRYAIVKALDPDRPATLHGGAPSALYSGGEMEQALNRGNDWFFADTLDGVGTSSFPKWSGIDDADFGIRVEFVKSAARGKRVWLSELQGGRSAIGFSLHPAVDARSQQRWVWNGLACGADTILFWCWRDEVFCPESGGFGLIGEDGFAEERLAAMRVTGRALERHAALLKAYRPARAEVGVLFSPQTFYHHWATEGKARRGCDALLGYARALVRRSIPYTVVEEEHLDALDGLRILFLPGVTATSPALEASLERFVRTGGTLLCETECGAFTPEGFYRYPADRFTARLTGRVETGRRPPAGATVTARSGAEAHDLAGGGWLTAWGPGPGRVLAAGPAGDLLVEVPVGKGRVILCGSAFGEAYNGRQHHADSAVRASSLGFERFCETCVRGAGWRPEIEILDPPASPDAFLYVKSGSSGGRRLLFVFFQEGQASARLRLAPGVLKTPRLTDLITAQTVEAVRTDDGGHALHLAAPDWGFAALAEG